jgi:hypothetical protein
MQQSSAVTVIIVKVMSHEKDFSDTKVMGYRKYKFDSVNPSE